MTGASDNDLARRATAASDIRTWLDRALPAAAWPYARLMRLDRPIGTWLLLFPCWWGFFLALDKSPLPYALQPPPQSWLVMGSALLFAIGAVVMRGAGCTYNDIVDRDFDAKVARTALRPIPSGQVSLRQAVVFLVAQLLVGLLILLTQVHILSFLGRTWGMGTPRFSTEQVVTWSQRIRTQGGAITWDVPIQPSGLIAQPFIDQLTAVGKALGSR